MQSESSAKAAQKARLAHALDVLVVALQNNAINLEEFAGIIGDSKAKWYFALDTSAWDTIKADIAPELTDPELRRKLAYHFGQLSALEDLNQQFLSFAFGVNRSMSSSDKTRESIKVTLVSLAKGTRVDALELISAATETRAKVLSPGSP